MNPRPLVPRWFAVMLAASLAIILLGLFQPRAAEAPAPEENATLTAAAPLAECMWLDRLPEDPYEPFQVYYFTEEGGRIGLNAKADSAFRVLRVFGMDSDQGRIQFLSPTVDRPATSHRS